jgi:hypothetical protein
MNITLRKANAIQNSINDVIKSIQVNGIVSINEFQNAEDLISARAKEAVAAYERKMDLTNALYSIRGAVAGANGTAGIDSRLTEVARLDKAIAMAKEMSELTVRTEANVITGKLDKIKNRKEESRSIYGREDEVNTGVLTQATVDQFKTSVLKLKKSKQKLQDEILELNVRTEITLSEQAVAVLSREGLL